MAQARVVYLQKIFRHIVEELIRNIIQGTESPLKRFYEKFISEAKFIKLGSEHQILARYIFKIIN